MVRANKIQIDKYKSEYIIKLVGVYIRQKCIWTPINIRTKMGNINWENFRMNYMNVNHLVRLYDAHAYYKILLTLPPPEYQQLAHRQTSPI